MGKNKEQKIVYRANKKLLKRLLIVTLVIFLIGVFAIPIKNGLELLYLKSWIWHDIEKYGFSIKLPRAYKDIELENNDRFGIISSIFNTEASVEVNEEYVSKTPDIVYNGGNVLNGIGLMIQCLETEKTTKTLDEIAESHLVLTTIYYEDEYTIGELEKEYVEILGGQGIRTSIDLSNKKGTKTMVSYLLPLEDKEITIMFLGDKESISKSLKEIDDIVSMIKGDGGKLSK